MQDQKEEELTNESGTVVDNTDYLEAIKTLKENSVDKSKYEQLRLENKRLLDAVVNGSEVAHEESVTAKPSVEELREKYLKEDQTNLEYITNALNLRDALIAEGKPDPFLPIGSQILPTDEDVTKANQVAEVLKECIEYADGNSDIFTNELQRRLVDVKIR